MTQSKVVYVNISNINKDTFEAILTELTSMIANFYFGTTFTTKDIYM